VLRHPGHRRADQGGLPAEGDLGRLLELGGEPGGAQVDAAVGPGRVARVGPEQDVPATVQVDVDEAELVVGRGGDDLTDLAQAGQGAAEGQTTAEENETPTEVWRDMSAPSR
jgi:hypothetical protein